MISIPKILLVCAVVLLASAYTEENNVLILTTEDFPSIIKEFPLILIEFYAPWCGHCKRLAPIYDEVATELKNAGSPVRLAKVDCDAHPSVKGSYSVQGFPTLLFFNNGVEVKYSGQRSKEFMVNWLSKKTRDPVVAITADQLAGLAADGKVNIVFHGDITSQQGSSISAIAVADDYNSTSPATQPTTPLPLASSPREPSRSSDPSANPPPPSSTRTSRAGSVSTNAPPSTPSTTAPSATSSASALPPSSSSSPPRPERRSTRSSPTPPTSGALSAASPSSSPTSPYPSPYPDRC